jgi:hypothetical protein
MGKREDLPTNLQALTARELLNFFRRATREENAREMRTIKEEYDRRGMKLKEKDYGAYKRINN